MSFKYCILGYLVCIALAVIRTICFGWKSSTFWLLGIATFSFACGITYLTWERRFVRRLAAMAPEERECKLATMNQASRERISKLLATHAA